MTAFPSIPLPIQAELYVSSSANSLGPNWVDISTDVYERQNIQITRGLSDWATAVTPSQCTFVLNNRSGNYSPSNVAGSYWGSIGQNTPLRISVKSEEDAFARTVSNGWGTLLAGDLMPFGDAWSTFELGGSSADFAVSSGVATHSVSGTTQYRVSRLSTVYWDVDVAITVSVLPGVTVTGGQIEPANIVLRGQSTTAYYMVRATIQPGGAVTLAVMDYLNNVLGGPVTAAVTHSASTLRVRAQIEGQTIRAKVWDPTTAEPYGWLIEATYVDAALSNSNVQVLNTGWVGVRSGVSASNTNALPIVFSYSNLVVRLPRYAGMLASIVPSASDISGADKTATITAAGNLRALAQSGAPAQSALRHSIPTLPTLVAYWPCEDASGSTSIASGISTVGTNPMAVETPAGNTPASLAAYSGFACSQPIVTLNGGYLFGLLPPYADTGTVQARAIVAWGPVGTSPDGSRILQILTYGTAQRWDVTYHTGGGLSVDCYDKNGTQLFTTGAIAFSVDNAIERIGLWITQSGGNINGQLSTLAVGAAAGGYSAFTVTGQTIAGAYAVASNPGPAIGGVAIGHITVETSATDIFALQSQLNAYLGEGSISRFRRLCSENNIDATYVDTVSVLSQVMGNQTPDTASNLIQSCAAVDLGILYEARGTLGLVYKSTGGHYAFPVVAALDVAAHQLSAQPQETNDDQQIANDWTVSRINGSSYEATLTTGRLSTLPPSSGGVGDYPKSASVNAQTDAALPDLATWLLHVGTVDEPRFPTIAVNLASQEISGNTALLIALASVDVDTQITIANWIQDTIGQLVRGYTENLNNFVWSFTFNCAPSSPYRVGVCDDGVTRGDSATTTLHAAISSSATSMQVDVGDSTLWTLNSSDWPFDINCDGERITVTAVSGTSSPQTFTVTRSVNGVVKAHTPGVKVSLFTPYYIGLGRN